MKRNTKRLMVAIVFATVLCSCGPTAEEMMKKYDAYDNLQMEVNKAGVSLEINGGMLVIGYSIPLLNTGEEFVNALADRWFVMDAVNPDLRLPVNTGIAKINSLVNGVAQPVTYGNSMAIGNLTERFLLICFEGIASTESKEAETPPLFFLVENKKGTITALTTSPLMANDLFTASYAPMFFSEQEYEGEIPFEDSKNVALHLKLSADLTKVTKLVLSIDKLTLTPADFDRQRKKSEKESIFKYLEKSMLRTEIAIQTVNGINVFARDTSGSLVISKLQFEGGGFETTSPLDIIDGKIIIDERPFICELTVINSCVYGTVKIETNECGTQSKYAVFNNITTPQNIPEHILNK